MHDFVLIPGAGGDGWYWHLLEAELVRRGYDVVAVTLPAGDPDAGLVEYTDAVLAAMGGVGTDVLVAQSLGGFTAPLVAQRTEVSMIVLLNAMTPKPGESPGRWWESTGSAQARAEQAQREGRSIDTEDLVADVFFHDVPPEVTAEAMRRGAPEQSDGPFVLPYPSTQWPDVQTRFLQGAEDRFFPIEFQRRVVAERLGMDLDEMPGGHLVALSQPILLADRLQAYRAELGSDR
ncbi:alpha/beta hydrolase [Rhodococcus sp. PAMC28707]|uniref:alpha/beta fold hydrolase n=1 Tax=unclassified Rhodococcus (in: high G+C Gram-positive bacteria) TaxID=192944 RepID=UPI00109D9A9E|nr:MULTISPECIES: alpha/beta hydrolase [unclassified Rhodococcus (in: high G+C Gram-positive bacteria)]QCB48885.1 alpha/beta hydrolase [Rhodococcus sp. PAMC28705]QCB59428.1 alpha/beta hydrolase [Rhodococcus sp. PAMC28707]